MAGRGFRQRPGSFSGPFLTSVSWRGRGSAKYWTPLSSRVPWRWSLTPDNPIRGVAGRAATARPARRWYPRPLLHRWPDRSSPSLAAGAPVPELLAHLHRATSGLACRYRGRAAVRPRPDTRGRWSGRAVCRDDNEQGALGRQRRPHTRTTGARRAHINAPRCDPAGSGAAWAALQCALRRFAPYAAYMTDVIVRATARGWASGSFPGGLEVSIVDAAGQEHRIVEKVPVLTTHRRQGGYRAPHPLRARPNRTSRLARPPPNGHPHRRPTPHHHVPPGAQRSPDR